MTPGSFSGGASSKVSYVITQPWIWLSYIKSFILPTELSADTDRGYVAWHSLEGILGFVGIGLIVWLICRYLSLKYRGNWFPYTIPFYVIFGLIWFLVTVLPTSIFPLAEVTNDHRMFVPLIGLAMTGVGLLSMIRYEAKFKWWGRVALAIVLVVMCIGVWNRNKVWSTEESLWADVTIKSPRNGRGWMNYGLTFMKRGQYQVAERMFYMAYPLTPNYWALETNMGILAGAMGKDQVAMDHFNKALVLSPENKQVRWWVNRWLVKRGERK
jgi:hypothetical protein